MGVVHAIPVDDVRKPWRFKRQRPQGTSTGSPERATRRYRYSSGPCPRCERRESISGIADTHHRLVAARYRICSSVSCEYRSSGDDSERKRRGRERQLRTTRSGLQKHANDRSATYRLAVELITNGVFFSRNISFNDAKNTVYPAQVFRRSLRHDWVVTDGNSITIGVLPTKAYYCQLKWDFVIEIVSPPRAGHRRPTLTSHGARGAEIGAGGAHIALVRRSTSPGDAGAIEHGEMPVELQHNLGRIAVLS